MSRTYDLSSQKFTRVLYALSALNGIRVGYQLVAIGWFSVKSAHQLVALSIILIVGSVSSVIFSPIIGRLVDRVEAKRQLVSLGNLLVFAIGLFPSLIIYFPDRLDTTGTLITVVIASTFANGVVTGSQDYFVKSFIPTSARHRVIGSLSLIAQISMVTGTGLAGWAVTSESIPLTFLFVAFCGLFAAVLSRNLWPDLRVAEDQQASSNEKNTYPRFLSYASHPKLLNIAICSALIMSLGHITNTLLPALIDISLKRSSGDYALVEIVWSTGAMLVGMGMAYRKTLMANRPSIDFFLIGLMGVAVAGVPAISVSFTGLLVMHGLLGAGFVLVRIRNEARFLSDCPIHLLGRYRSNSVFLTNVLGLMVFATPIAFSAMSVTKLYWLLGGLLVITACFAGIKAVRSPSIYSSRTPH